MKHPARLRALTDAADLLDRFTLAATRCRSCLHPDPKHSVMVHVMDALNGWPGVQAYETDRSSGHATVVDDDAKARPTVADPTGEAAILRDHAAADLREIDRRIGRIRRDVEFVVATTNRYVPHTAPSSARRETSRFNDPGCGSCARLPSPADPKVARYEPPHTRTLYVFNGRVLLLCWFCRRWVKDTGRLPTKDELDAHHRGETVRRPA